MSDQMKAVFESLLPPGAIWRPKPDGDFDRLLAGMGDNAQEMFNFLAQLANIRNPRRTPILSDLEKEFGIVTNTGLTVAERIAELIAAKYTVPTTASFDNLQDRLRAAGFDGIIVTPNDPAENPATISGELLVNTPLYVSQNPAYLAQANGDNTFAGNALAVAGYFVNNNREEYEYSIPSDWRYWRFFFFVGGAKGSPWTIAVHDVNYKLEQKLKRLVLAGKPKHSWAILVVNYKMFFTSQAADAGYIGSFLSATYGNDLYVLGGQGGEIQTSPDGEIWTHRAPAGSYVGQFWAATYGRGLYLMAGDNGGIQTSPDGENWTAQTPDGGYTGSFLGATYANGLFILVGTNGEIQTSPDGINWTAQAAAGGYTGSFRTATYGKGLFVIAGDNGEIQTSPDGENWTHRSPAGAYSGYIFGVVFGNDRFIFCGTGPETQRSFDGINWTQEPTGGSNDLIVAIYTGVFFLVAGDGGDIFRSPDGENWTPEAAAGGFSGTFLAGTFGKGNVILAGGAVGSSEIQKD